MLRKEEIRIGENNDNLNGSKNRNTQLVKESLLNNSDYFKFKEEIKDTSSSFNSQNNASTNSV